MIKDFERVECGASLVAAIQDLAATRGTLHGRPVVLEERALAMQSCLGRCHVCGGAIEDGEIVWERFADSATELPAHAWCHESRSGIAGVLIRLSIHLGNWVVRRAVDDKGSSSKWRRPLIEEWAGIDGCRIGAVLQHGPLPGWRNGQAITGDASFMRIARLLFIHERERIKWRHVVPDLPLWEPDQDWKSYWTRYRSAIEGKTVPRSGGALPDVSARTSGSCALCGDRESIPATPWAPARVVRFEADHILPHDKGGTDDLGNLQPLHRSCNGLQGLWDRSPGEIVLAVSVGRWLIDLVRELNDGRAERSWEQEMWDWYVRS